VDLVEPVFQIFIICAFVSSVDFQSSRKNHEPVLSLNCYVYYDAMKFVNGFILIFFLAASPIAVIGQNAAWKSCFDSNFLAASTKSSFQTARTWYTTVDKS